MSFGFGFGFPRRAAAGGAAPSLNFDFTSLTSLPSRITFSRTSNATLTDSNGRVAYAPHNLLTNSEDFEASAWVKSPSGVGLAPVVTANAAVAPDGTTTADLVVLNKNGGTTGSDWSWLYQNTTPAANTTYIFSVWVKAATVGDIGKVVLLSSVLTQLVTLTADWQRVTTTGTTASTGTISQGIRVRGGEGTADTASFYVWGAQLNVANAPVNLLTFSEQFDNAVWTKTNVTATADVTTAPNGTTTADSLVENTVNGTHEITSTASLSLITANTVFTASIYVKRASGSRNLRFTGYAGSDGLRALFNLDTLTVTNGSYGTSTYLSGSITSVGNGWFLCTVSGSISAASPIANWSLLSGVAINYPGDGTSGLFLWGAQLNTGSTALPYVATTSSIYLPPSYNSTTPKNLLGFTQEFDNAAWTKSNSFVQTNLLTFSEQFDNTSAWTTSAANIAANSVASPNGTIDADTLTSNGTLSQHVISAAPSLAATTTYAFSVYAKAASTNFLQITTNLTAGSANHYANFNLQTGVVSAVGSSATATIQDVGNGWYRCTAVMTTVSANATATFILIPVDSGTATRNPSFSTVTSVYIWGAQLVQGSVPGDYQVTTSAVAAVQYSDPNGTRTADLLTATAGTALLPRVADLNVTTITDTTYTASIYIKQDTYTFAQIYLNNQSSEWANFTLSGAGSATANGTCTANIQVVGNGFYRISMTYKAGGLDRRPFFMLAASASATRAQSWNPVGTEAFFIWGAQLSNSASVDPYVYNPQAAPTSTAYYGPRFDYNPTGTRVLGTELVTNGDFSNGTTGWSSARATLSVVNGALRATATTAFANVSQGLSTVAGRTYYVTCSFLGGNTSKVIGMYAGTTSFTGDLAAVNMGSVASTQTMSFVATGATSYIFFQDASGNFVAGDYYDLDNISVREVTGYTATANGLLVEEQRTNLLTYSEDFSNVVWAKVDATISANQAVAPDGTTTGDLFTESATTAFHYLQVSFASTATAYTNFVYAKQASGTRRLVLREGVNTGAYATFDLSTGVVAASGAGGAGTITPVGNGWYRCALTYTAVAGTSSVQITLTNGTTFVSYAGDGTSGIYVWGAQLEAGSFATSYIPTVASQVTRAADNASMLGDNFATWYNATEGTLLGQGLKPALSSSNSVLATLFTASGTRMLIGNNVGGGGSTEADFYVQNSGSDQAWLRFASAVSANTVFKIAGAYKANDFAASANAATALTDTSGTVPSIASFAIGNGGSSAAYFNGTIRSISYYPTRLPNATLQSITA